MKLSRPSRFVAALVALVSVLFTQLAVAAYACPSMQMELTVALATTVAVDEDHHMMPDCEEMDMEQPVLCHAHSQVGNQSLDKPAPPDVPPSVAIVLVPAIQDIGAAQRTLPPNASAAWLMHDFAPPLSIRNCCFRI